MCLEEIQNLYALAIKGMGCWGLGDEQARKALMEAASRLYTVGLDHYYED